MQIKSGIKKHANDNVKIIESGKKIISTILTHGFVKVLKVF